jgi:hypothetical protein
VQDVQKSALAIKQLQAQKARMQHEAVERETARSRVADEHATLQEVIKKFVSFAIISLSFSGTLTAARRCLGAANRSKPRSQRVRFALVPDRGEFGAPGLLASLFFVIVGERKVSTRARVQRPSSPRESGGAKRSARGSRSTQPHNAAAAQQRPPRSRGGPRGGQRRVLQAAGAVGDRPTSSS